MWKLKGFKAENLLSYKEIGGSEKKIYQDGQIFIKDGENFEIRFFNPLQEKIGVEIIFNGIKKNDGLLVLRPGEDITLDRFLGEKKKMKYETYIIDGGNDSAVKASELNGLIEFKFYKEKTYNTTFTICNSTGIFPQIQTFEYPGAFTTNTGYGTTLCGTSVTSSAGVISNFKSKVETGRIEKGPESNQDLKTVDIEFEYTPFHTINYYLKPNSQKPTEITEVRNYCPVCGYRIRKSTWKFCPKCSEKL